MTRVAHMIEIAVGMLKHASQIANLQNGRPHLISQNPEKEERPEHFVINSVIVIDVPSCRYTNVESESSLKKVKPRIRTFVHSQTPTLAP